MKITEERIREYIALHTTNYVNIIEYEDNRAYYAIGVSRLSKELTALDILRVLHRTESSNSKWKPTPEFLHFLITKEIDDAVSS